MTEQTKKTPRCFRRLSKSKKLRKIFASTLLAVAATAPLDAYADPITVFAVVEAATGIQALAAAAAIVASYGTYIAAAALYTLSAMDARRRARNAREDARRAYNAALQNQGQIQVVPDPDIRLIYGQRAVGGYPVATFTTDKTGVNSDGSTYTKKDGLKHVVILLGKGPILSIDEVQIDNVGLGGFDSNGYVTHTDYSSSSNITYTATIGSGGTYTSSFPIGYIQGAEIVSGSGESASFTDVTSSVSLSGDNLTISGPVGATVRYVGVSTNKVLRVQRYVGTDSQTANAYLMSVVPSKWTSNHRLRGWAYVILTLDLEYQPFQGGLPNIQFRCRGRLIYDPRQDSTRAGGSGSQRITYPNTWTYSNNPALIAADYLQQEVGLAVDGTQDINWDSVALAANVCDQAITLKVGTTTTPGQPQYTCDAVVGGVEDPMAVLSDMAATMLGEIVYGEQWYMFAGQWTTPIRTITDDDLDGEITLVQAGEPIESSFNGLRGTFVEGFASVPSDFPPYKNDSFVLQDGEEVWEDITLPYTSHRYRANQICRVLVERNRCGLVLAIPLKLDHWDLRAGCRIQVYNTEYGLAGAVFIIQSWNFSIQGSVVLTVKLDVATNWDYADAVPAFTAVTSNLGNPGKVADITGLSATSGASLVLVAADGSLQPRIQLSWDPTTDRFANSEGRGYYEILWDAYSGGASGRIQVDSTKANAMVSPSVRVGQRVSFRMRLWNGYTWSNTATTSAVLSVGSTLGSVVSGFHFVQVSGGVQLYWDIPTSMSGYMHSVLKVGASLGTATEIWRGNAVPAFWPFPGAGTYTLWVYHEDYLHRTSTALSIPVTVSAAGTVTMANLASDVTSYLTGIETLANDAFNDAAAAQNDATTALTALGRIASDTWLSKGEKPSVIQQYDTIIGEYTGIVGTATAYGVTTEKTAYINAVSALSSYLTGLSPTWTDVSQDTPIVANTFKQKFTDVYVTRQAMLSQVSTIAGTRANWATVTGAGKPADYATSGKNLAMPFDQWGLAGQSIISVSDGKVGSSALQLDGSNGHPEQQNYIAIDRAKKYRVRFWARPVGSPNGVFYFCLRQFTDTAGTAGPSNGGRDPYKPSGWGQSQHISAFGSTDWGEYSYIWSTSDWQPGVKYVRPNFLQNFGGTVGYWQVQDFTMEEVTAVTAAQAAADAAQTTANDAIVDAADAQYAADQANSKLADLAADGKLTSVEKQLAVVEWRVIAEEYGDIDAKAATYGITTERTNWSNNWYALSNYLGSLSPAWNDTNNTTDIDPTTWRNKWANYYYYRQVLLNKIAAIAKALADAAQTTANDALSDAADAQYTADQAEIHAQSAISDINVIYSDNVLSRDEKPGLIQEYNSLSAESTPINSQATALGVTTELSAYNTAFSNLGSYLGGLSPSWSDVSQNTNITGTTFRSYWVDVYDKKQKVLNAIAAAAALRANWASVSGRPTSYRVVANGSGSTTHPTSSGFYAGESGSTIFGAARSYMLVIIRRSDGAIVYTNSFDVFGSSSNADVMASVLNGYGSGYIAVVYTYDEPQNNRLTSALTAAMYRCGASPAIFGSNRFRYRSAYILIGICGCGQGNGFEAYQGDADNDSSAWCDISFQVQNGNMLITGAGSSPRTLQDYGYSGDMNATYGAEVGVNLNGVLPSILPVYFSGTGIAPYSYAGRSIVITTDGIVRTTSGSIVREVNWKNASSTLTGLKVSITQYQGTAPVTGAVDTQYALTSDVTFAWSQSTVGSTYFEGTINIHNSAGAIICGGLFSGDLATYSSG